MSLSHVLRELQMLSPDVLEAAEARAHDESVTLVHLLTREGVVDDELIARVLAVHLRVDRVDLDTRAIDRRIAALLPPVLAGRYRVVPIGLRRTREGDVLYAAMSNPDDDLAFMEVQAATGLRLVPLVATDGAITRALARVYGQGTASTSGDLVVPDEESRTRVVIGIPIVVGEIVEDTSTALTRKVESLEPVHSDDQQHDEWLMSSTREVLAAHAPVLAITDPDFEWLKVRRDTSRAHAQPLIPTTALVAEDIGLRAWLVDRLHHAIPDLFPFALIEEVAEFAATGALANLVLIDPPSDARLIQILGAIADAPAPPRVIAVSANKAFSVVRGVERRFDPFSDDERLAVTLLAALYREGT